MRKNERRIVPIVLLCLAVALAAGAARSQDLCPVGFCDDPITSICDAGGFKITLTDFQDASAQNSGTASYTYEICSPPEGTCSLDAARSCLDNDKCDQFDAGDCNRECAIDSFRDLSHFDVGLPLVGAGSCLGVGTLITGSCSGGDPFEVGPDGSCGNVFVAKCDGGLSPGECYEMTINIPGELNEPGLGAAFVVSKESGDCNESCIAGPSCDPCNGGTPGTECLTRTIGFWGNHPWITNDYDPVTVCGHQVGCDPLAGDGACLAGTCDSITEALCSSPGRELRKNTAYVQLIRQLTAAKLNLNATSDLFDASCSTFEHDGMGIADWINFCESFCAADGGTISDSGCLEALDAFNNSQDTGFVQTPAPFDRPPVDDSGNIAGADPVECRKAKGTGRNPRLVIGKKVNGNDCRP